MKKKSWIIITCLIILIVVVALALKLTAQPAENSSTAVSRPPISINYSNMESMLSKNELVKNLPSTGIILLKFYSIKEGSKIFEKLYVIKKGDVKEGEEKADITLEVDSKYLKVLTDQNFCSTMQSAQENGDFNSYTSISKTSLLWKYRGMLKYRSCLGL